MSNTQIAKGFSLTNPGQLDSRKGPYPTLSEACRLIPNTTKVVDGATVNYRDGMTVLIGTPTNYTRYCWKGGFADSNLVEFQELAPSGVFFSNPTYEVDGFGDIYCYPGVFSSTTTVFAVKGSRYSDYDFDYARIKADIAATPAASVVLGATSPSGITDCIKFLSIGRGCLYYNPTTRVFLGSDRQMQKFGWLKIIENNAGTPGDCTEQAVMLTQLMKAKIQSVAEYDPQKNFVGANFNEPTYEIGTNGDIFLKTKGFAGGTEVFAIKGSLYPDYGATLDQIKADLAASPSQYVITGATSPSGLTDCIQFTTNGRGGLYFNPTTKKFLGSGRAPQRKGWIKLIENNAGVGPGDCTERDVILSQLMKAKIQSVPEYDPQRNFIGANFNEPTYEIGTNGDIFLKTKGFAGGTEVFSMQGSLYPNYGATLDQIKADLAAIPSQFVITGVTSPSGLTDCIQFTTNGRGGLYFNPNTKKFLGAGRAPQRVGWIKLIENNAGIGPGDCTEKAAILTQLMKNSLNTVSAYDPQKNSLGAAFYNPIYEVSGTVLYLKPQVLGTGSDVFHVRGGFYPDTSFTYDKIKADILANPHPTVSLGQTSPSGLDDCIKITITTGYGCLWYNPITKVFLPGARVAQKTGWIKLIENHGGFPGDCTEKAAILTSLLKSKIPTNTGGTTAERTYGQGLQIVAHRGARLYDAPEDTLEAYKQAALIGFKYVETDLWVTSDGEFILVHDESLNRTFTNPDGSDIAGSLTIAQITYAQARSYLARSPYAKYQKPVPNLDEFLLLCYEMEITPVIEIKRLDPSLDAKFIAKTRRYFKDSEIQVASFDDALLARLRLKSDYGLSFLSGSITAAAASKGWVNQDFTLPITEDYFNQAIAAGVPVGAWTVTSQSEYNRLYKLGLKFMTTDNIPPIEDKAIGEQLGFYQSDLNFSGCILTQTAVAAGQGLAVISQNGDIKTAPLPMTKKGAVYATINVKGSAVLYLLIDGIPNESITINTDVPQDYEFAKMLNVDTQNCQIRVSANTAAQVYVYDIRFVTKRFLI